MVLSLFVRSSVLRSRSPETSAPRSHPARRAPNPPDLRAGTAFTPAHWHHGVHTHDRASAAPSVSEMATAGAAARTRPPSTLNLRHCRGPEGGRLSLAFSGGAAARGPGRAGLYACQRPAPGYMHVKVIYRESRSITSSSEDGSLVARATATHLAQPWAYMSSESESLGSEKTATPSRDRRSEYDVDVLAVLKSIDLDAHSSTRVLTGV